MWTLFLKEAREIIRDRRTLLLSVALPAVIYPLLMAGITELTAAATLSMRARVLLVGVAADVPPDVRQALEKLERTKVQESSHVVEDVKQHVVRVGVAMGAPQGAGGDPVVQVVLDAADDESRGGSDRVDDALDAVREARLLERALSLSVKPAFMKPLPVIKKNVSEPERMGSYAASRMLPFLLIILSLVGASATAVDTTAGERERGTLLTLLSTPVRAGEVAAAKLLACALVALGSGLVNVLSLGTSMAAILGQHSAMTISPRVIVGCAVALIPTTLYGSALMLGLAALAKSTKEAQGTQAPAMFGCIGLSAVSVAPGVKSGLLLDALPVAGPALLMRDLIMGDATWQQGATVAAATAVTLWVMVGFAARVLTSEPMLSTNLSPAAVVRDLAGGNRATSFSAGILAAVLLAVSVYAGVTLQSMDLVLGLMATLVLLAGSGLLVLRLMHLPIREVMGLKTRPPATMLLAAFLLGCSSFLPILVVEDWLVELAGMKDAVQELQKLMGAALQLDLPPWQQVALLGALPAFFEELAFRGALTGVLLQVTRPRTAVLVQAAVFGLAHQSLMRFPPTFALGLLMGVLRVRSGSVWPGMVMHMMHNALMAASMAYLGDADTAALMETLVTPAGAAGVLLVMAAGLFLLFKGAKTAAPAEAA